MTKKKSLPSVKKSVADFLSTEEVAISTKQEERVSTYLMLSDNASLNVGDASLYAEHWSW